MHKFFESIAKLSLLLRILILVGSVGLVVAGFLLKASMGAADPKAAYHKELANLRRAQQERAEVTRAKAEEKQQCEELGVKLKKAKEKKKAFRGMLPDDPELSMLIKDIKAKLSGLTLVEYARLPEVTEPIYAKIPLDITVEGSFHQLLKFLHEISILPRIIKVSGIKLLDPKRSEGRWALRVGFRVSTFRYLSGAEQRRAARAAAEKKGKK
ncbi:MAG: type 4a pilus biogenesis protein PilO [Polyangia bacterium]|jgi:type IV pilus assembly protein PilO|nr:type 4a pilus biogenesis protein PilO [Polyangia bacterium]